MVEELEQLIEKNQIEKFQKQATEIDAQSVKTICSESFVYRKSLILKKLNQFKFRAKKSFYANTCATKKSRSII